MPQTSDRLRAKFFGYNAQGRIVDDGIGKAEDVITAAGGSIEQGWITYSGEDGEAWDAIQFLIEEWDYALQPSPTEELQHMQQVQSRQSRLSAQFESLVIAILIMLAILLVIFAGTNLADWLLGK